MKSVWKSRSIQLRASARPKMSGKNRITSSLLSNCVRFLTSLNSSARVFLRRFAGLLMVRLVIARRMGNMSFASIRLFRLFDHWRPNVTGCKQKTCQVKNARRVRAFFSHMCKWSYRYIMPERIWRFAEFSEDFASQSRVNVMIRTNIVCLLISRRQIQV